MKREKKKKKERVKGRIGFYIYTRDSKSSNSSIGFY